MKFGFFLFVSSLVVTNIYASNCYSVGLIDVQKSNASTLKERFHVPSECITPTIGRFVSVRCGCYDTTREAKQALRKKYRKYKDATIVQTRRSRFSKSKPKLAPRKTKRKVIHHKTPVHIAVAKTPQKVIEIPEDAQIDLVQIDPKTGKLIVIKSAKESTTIVPEESVKKEEKEKVAPKVIHTKVQHKRKPIVHKEVTLQKAKPIPKTLLHTTPQSIKVTQTQHHKSFNKVDTIKDEKILQKLHSLKPQLKKEPKEEESFKIIEPKKIKPLKKHTPKKEKKYMHEEEDDEISDILEFIDEDEELNLDAPSNKQKDEDFFYDDFSEENDVYLDD